MTLVLISSLLLVNITGAEVPDKVLVPKLAEVSGALMRPDGFFTTAFGLIVARIVEKNHIQVAVAVSVVIADVNFIGKLFVCILDSFPDLAVVVSIVGKVMGKGDGTVHVKLGTVLVIGIVDVIIPYRADGSVQAVP